jgi:protein phosphatase
VDGREPLIVPARGLVVLIGASGAGKSTFARRHFRPTEILASDAFRAMVSDDERDQTASAAAFDLLHRALAHRLRRGRLTVVDATNADPAVRRALLRLAVAARRPAVAIVLDLPEDRCLAQNAGRDGRVVAPEVVQRQIAAVRRSLTEPARLLAEGFAAVHVLRDGAAIDDAAIVRDEAFRGAPAIGVRPPEPDATGPGRGSPVSRAR